MAPISDCDDENGGRQQRSCANVGEQITFARILNTRAPATDDKADRTLRQWLEFCTVNPRVGSFPWSAAGVAFAAFLTVRLRKRTDPPQPDGWVRPTTWRHIEPHSLDSQLSTTRQALARAGFAINDYDAPGGPADVAKALGCNATPQGTPKTPLFAWQALAVWATKKQYLTEDDSRWWTAVTVGLYFCLRPDMIHQCRRSWFTVYQGGLLLCYKGNDKPRRRIAAAADNRLLVRGESDPRESAARGILISEILIPWLSKASVSDE